jgi:P-type Ca2+ transporter type 2C
VTETEPDHAPAPAQAEWHSLAPASAAAALGTDEAAGLSPGEAARRLAESGFNELAEKPRPGFLSLLFDQFKDFLVLILIGAAIVSLILGEWVDAAAIIMLVILNAVIGVVQESRAEKALAALKRMAAPDARVVRGGRTLVIPSRELVPGDVVLLEAGNHVPADARLTETVNLRVEEASLTGESVPVEKHAHARVEETAALGDRTSMAWMGTTVTFGRGRGMVTCTGMRTQIGLIAAMLQDATDEDTPLQKKLTQVGRALGIGALAICAIVFLVGIVEGRNILVMFMTAVSLAIAAVPEGLPAIVTICLALGMQEMIKRHALIRRLPAVETLGSATTICTDKTGTLTQNEMTATRLWADGEIFTITGEGWQPRGEVRKGDRRAELRDYGAVRLLLQAGMLASDARLEIEPARGPSAEPVHRMVGDPTEGALVVAAAKAGLHRERVERVFPRVAEIPFDAERKRMSTIHAAPAAAPAGPGAVVLPPADPAAGDFVMFVKGAPDLLLERCAAVHHRGEARRLTEADRQGILHVNAELASGALRVLGVAWRRLSSPPGESTPPSLESDLTFLGLIGMMDPARPEAGPAIDIAHGAGLRVIMVTGDYPETAAAVGRSIGLLQGTGRVLSGRQIDALDDPALSSALDTTSVFARVSPQHKVRIVDALKNKGQIVGMTGDGVNDAPALRHADIGIAMGLTGTDVTRETADMVLTDDNFASIISAVEQGRIIFSNIRKFVYFLLSCNLGEIGTIFLGTLLGWPIPLTAIQLLWMNLLTDGAPALALGMERGEPGIMTRPPRPVAEPIINGSMGIGLALQAVAITAVSLCAFWVGMNVFGSVETGQTMAFVTLSGCQVVRAYTNRSERASVFALGVFSNAWMQYAALTSSALLLAVVYIPGLNTVFNAVPLSGLSWAYLAPLLVLPAIIDELTKWGMRARDRRTEERRGAADPRGAARGGTDA